MGAAPAPRRQETASLADAVRQITAGSFEGSPKWLTLSRDQAVLDYAAQQAVTRNPELFDVDCAVMPVVAYLSDHREETLDRVVRAAQGFAREPLEPASAVPARRRQRGVRGRDEPRRAGAWGG